MISDSSVLAVDCYSGKVADVLVRACKLIEQSCLTAVLISRKSKSKRCAFCKHNSVFQFQLFVLGELTDTGVRSVAASCACGFMRVIFFMYILYCYLACFLKP